MCAAESSILGVLKTYVKRFNEPECSCDALSCLMVIYNLGKDYRSGGHENELTELLVEMDSKVLVKVSSIIFNLDCHVFLRVTKAVLFIFSFLNKEQIKARIKDILEFICCIKEIIELYKFQPEHLINSYVSWLTKTSELCDEIVAKINEIGLPETFWMLSSKINSWSSFDAVHKFSFLIDDPMKSSIQCSAYDWLVASFFEVSVDEIHNLHKDILMIMAAVYSEFTSDNQEETIQNLFRSLAWYCRETKTGTMLIMEGVYYWIEMMLSTTPHQWFLGTSYVIKLCNFTFDNMLGDAIDSLCLHMTYYLEIDQQAYVLDILREVSIPKLLYTIEEHHDVISNIKGSISSILGSKPKAAIRGRVLRFISTFIKNDIIRDALVCPLGHNDFIATVLTHSILEFTLSLKFEAAEDGLLSAPNCLKFHRCYVIISQIVLTQIHDSVHLPPYICSYFTMLMKNMLTFIKSCHEDMMELEDRHPFYFHLSHPESSGVFYKTFKLFTRLFFVPNKGCLQFLNNHKHSIVKDLVSLLKFNVNKLQCQDEDFVDIMSLFLRQHHRSNNAYLSPTDLLCLSLDISKVLVTYFCKVSKQLVEYGKVDWTYQIFQCCIFLDEMIGSKQAVPSAGILDLILENLQNIQNKVDEMDEIGNDLLHPIKFRIQNMCLKIFILRKAKVKGMSNEIGVKRLFGNVLHRLLEYNPSESLLCPIVLEAIKDRNFILKEMWLPALMRLQEIVSTLPWAVEYILESGFMQAMTDGLSTCVKDGQVIQKIRTPIEDLYLMLLLPKNSKISFIEIFYGSGVLELCRRFGWKMLERELKKYP